MIRPQVIIGVVTIFVTTACGPSVSFKSDTEGLVTDSGMVVSAHFQASGIKSIAT